MHIFMQMHISMQLRSFPWLVTMDHSHFQTASVWNHGGDASLSLTTSGGFIDISFNFCLGQPVQHVSALEFTASVQDVTTPVPVVIAPMSALL